MQSSLLSHAARATIMPARFVRMRTFAIAITYVRTYVRTKYYYVISSTNNPKVLLFRVAPPPSTNTLLYYDYGPYHNVWPEAVVVVDM